MTDTDLAAALREALEATEWHCEDGHGPPQCTVCDGWGDAPDGPGAGHTPECIVGRALGREPGKGHPALVAEAQARAEFYRTLWGWPKRDEPKAAGPETEPQAESINQASSADPSPGSGR